MRNPLLVNSVMGLVLFTLAMPAMASPDSPGPCSNRLQQLGYSRVELEAVHDHSSIYEARRGREEVKLMVRNGTCTVEKVWPDE